MKKLNVLKIEMKFFQTIFRFFCENHPPTRQIKYKMINFSLSNTSIMAIKLPSTKLKRLLTWIKYPLTR